MARNEEEKKQQSVSVLVFVTDIPAFKFLIPGNDQIINTVLECKVKGM